MPCYIITRSMDKMIGSLEEASARGGQWQGALRCQLNHSKQSN